MSHIKRKYIDSHWLVFFFQGAIALLFGCLTLFTSAERSSGLIPLIGVFLLALAVVEFTNSIYRSRNQQGWLVSTLVALYDAAFGITMLVILNQGMAWHLIFLALYTIIRGVFQLLIGFRTTVDPTDRFIWLLCGVCALVFGIVILNSGHLASVDYLRFFGAYMLIYGACSLIYGEHNRNQKLEDVEARQEAEQSSARGRLARLRSATRGKAGRSAAPSARAAKSAGSATAPARTSGKAASSTNPAGKSAEKSSAPAKTSGKSAKS